MADRGFNIGDDIGLHRAKLEIPAFKKKGQDQFSQKDVEFSARLAKVRIHIERVIGLLKNKYTILQGTLPIRLIKHKNDSEYPHIDKIVSVCCALTNLSQSIVPCKLIIIITMYLDSAKMIYFICNQFAFTCTKPLATRFASKPHTVKVEPFNTA